MIKVRLRGAGLTAGFILHSLISAPIAGATTAQPVPIPEDPSTMPQIEIDGVGISTLKLSKFKGGQHEGSIDFSDSAVMLGAAQRLYGGGVGSFGLGGQTVDESIGGTGTSLFLNQAFLDFQQENWEFLVGRTDNPTAHLVDFPTLRGDDFLNFTNPPDPLSNGANLEERRYSNVASVTLNQDFTYFENFHVQHLIDSQGSSSAARINSYGVNFEYLSPPGIEALQRVVSAGFGYEHETVREGSSTGLHMFYGGGVLNLNQSVTDRWDIRFQDIVSLGSDVDNIGTLGDSFRADSNAIAASLRFLKSPFGRPGYQLALTGGYKSYLKAPEANTAGLALTGVKRLGQGFDLAAQYLGEWQGRDLASASGVEQFQHKIEVGFIFDFGATFNQHITPRRSLLNLQHQYVPN